MKIKTNKKTTRSVARERRSRSLQRVVSRTDTQLLDALQELPWRIDIIYKEGQPKSDSVPPLRDQINHFLNMQSAANADIRHAGPDASE